MRKGSYLLFIFLGSALCMAYGALSFTDLPHHSNAISSPIFNDISDDSIQDNDSEDVWECSICQQNNPNWKLFCEVCWN
jgi:hypothetical protein